MPSKSTKITYTTPKLAFIVDGFYYQPRIKRIFIHAETEKSYWVLHENRTGKYGFLRIVHKRENFLVHDTWEEARTHLLNLFKNQIESLQTQIRHIDGQIERIQSKYIPDTEALEHPSWESLLDRIPTLPENVA